MTSRKKKPSPQMYEKKEKSVSYPKFSSKPIPKGFVPLKVVVDSVTNTRQTTKYESLVTPGGSCGIPLDKLAPNIYTGDRVKGVSLMHKSCFQPVFSDQEAKEHASMRR